MHLSIDEKPENCFIVEYIFSNVGDAIDITIQTILTPLKRSPNFLEQGNRVPRGPLSLFLTEGA